jgi:peptide/nickel transport system ATP-binding protein
LCEGRIIRQGRVDEALSAPLDDYTRRLIEAVPQLRQDWLAEMTGYTSSSVSTAAASPLHAY